MSYRVPIDADFLLLRASDVNIYAENSLLNIPRGTILRFVVKAGSSVLAHDPVVFTNYPAATHFDRNIFFSHKG